MNIEMAKRFVECRKNAGLSQGAVAEKLGVSRQAVSKWERGDAVPDVDNFVKLATLYGVSFDLLYFGKENELLTKEAPVEEAPVEEAPVEEAPAEEEPVEECSECAECEECAEECAECAEECAECEEENENGKKKKLAMKLKKITKVTEGDAEAMLNIPGIAISLSLVLAASKAKHKVPYYLLALASLPVCSSIAKAIYGKAKKKGGKEE